MRKKNAARSRLAAAPQWRNFDEWRMSLSKGINGDPKAQKIWKEITSCHSEIGALFALSYYANEKLQLNTCDLFKAGQRLASVLDQTARASKIAHQRKGDPRGLMFARRANDKLEELLLRTPWPGSGSTFGQAVIDNPVLQRLPIDQLSTVSRRSLDGVRREAAMPWLAVLRDYAHVRGLNLSWDSIGLLAWYAYPQGTDAGNIARSLRQWSLVESVIISRPRWLAAVQDVLIQMASAPRATMP